MQSLDEELSPGKHLVIAASLWGQVAHTLSTDPVQQRGVGSIEQLGRSRSAQFITATTLEGVDHVGDVGGLVVELPGGGPSGSVGARQAIVRDAVAV